jgi:LPXTG-site transpeptidase (sortase) family protein
MAQYATVTVQPNNKEGNTFIYAHNRVGVFHTLSRINVGDTVIITTDNGHTLTYKFRTSYETNPNDTSLFSYKGAPILTLQTCSGVWYQNRQLFTFDLVEAL